MPIRADLRAFYGRHWRDEIRPAVLKRAGGQCEQCGKPDRARIYTATGRRLIVTAAGAARIEPVMFWTLAPAIVPTPVEIGISGDWMNHRGRLEPGLESGLAYGRKAGGQWGYYAALIHAKPATIRTGPVVERVAQLGVAHLNNAAGDDRLENLRALCNWCHLIHDAAYHSQTRATRKDAERPILILVERAAGHPPVDDPPVSHCLPAEELRSSKPAC